MFEDKIGGLKQTHLYRFLRTVESDQGPEIVFEGKKYLNFSSNNYLGLASHPKLKEAAVRATKEHGTGSGASRLVTGSMTLHKKLEEKIILFKGTESALLFNSGYHANIGVIPALAGRGDLIFSDELNHASLIDGCRLSHAKTEVYRHGDVGHLEELLDRSQKSEVRSQKSREQSLVIRQTAGGQAGHWSLEAKKERQATPARRSSNGGSDKRRLIITDSLFSMEGNLCNLPKIMDLAEKYDAYVYVDEAHATGVFGKTGRGVVEHFGIDPCHPMLIQMGTFGKALGSFGAFVCGSSELIDYLINHARSFIYTTSLPPGVIAASMAAIDLVSEDLSYKEKLWKNTEYFGKQLGVILSRRRPPLKHGGSPPANRRAGASGGKNPAPKGPFRVESTGSFVPSNSRGTQDDTHLSPIFPITIGNSQKTMDVSSGLFKKGIWAQGIRPPSVPEGAARIRLTLMATHNKDHMDRCLDALNSCLRK